MPTAPDSSPSPTASPAGAAPYLPDLCRPRVALAVVLVAELVAIALSLARYDIVLDFWVDLARTSLYLLWVGLCGTFVLCRARRYLYGLGEAAITAISFGLLICTTALIGEGTYRVGQLVLGPLQNTGHSFFPEQHWSFLAGSVGIAGIVGALMLRYFYVTHQWRTNVEMEARSRVSALQARMRPHFLFNSMNTIAALTRSDPTLAEQAVEDLSELLRASLVDTGQRIRLRDELEMARVYQRIEQLRLGERLQVLWDTEQLPGNALIPALTIQPLLENAIYHGIEPLPGGGTVTLHGELDGNQVRVTVTNPIDAHVQLTRHAGHRMALNNIRERLQLAYAQKGELKIEVNEHTYRVTLSFPLEEQRA